MNRPTSSPVKSPGAAPHAGAVVRRAWAVPAPGALALLVVHLARLGVGCEPCSSWGGAPHDLTECGGQCVDVQSSSAHCGDCFNECVDMPGLAACCYSGECRFEISPTTLAVTRARPRDLAVDETHVYWTTGAGGSVERVLKTGGEVQVLADGYPGANAVAVDASHVYWAVACGAIEGYVADVSCTHAEAAIMRAPMSGGQAEVVAGPRGSDAGRLVLDDTNVYFTTAQNGLWRVDKAGGDAEQLTADGSFGALQIDGNDLYFAGTYDVSLPADGCPRHIYRVPVTGGEAQQLTSSDAGCGPSVQSLVLSPTEIIWLEYARPESSDGFGALRSMARTGGAESLLTSVGVGAPDMGLAQQSVAVVGSVVYWDVDGDVRALSLGGGVGETVLSYPCGTRFGYGNSVVADEDNVYFSGDRSVVKRVR